MRLRQREEIQKQDDAGAPGDEVEAELDSVREAGERLLRVGDAAIAQALSSDSEAFLRASRQEGGQ